MLRPLVVATLALSVACSSHTVSELPAMDGYGPVGDGRGAGGGAGGGSSGAHGGAGAGSSQPGGGAGSGSGGGDATGNGAGGASGGSSSGASGGQGAGTGDAPDAGGAGSEGSDAGSGHADAGTGAGTTQLLALCVQQINGMRAQAGAAPLDEATDLEAYAAQAAASDARSGNRHGYFYATGGGNGVAATEDELDGAQIAPGADAQATFEQGFQQDVQARGGAYANLVDTQLASAGCGFAQDAGGNWWVVMALR